MQEQKRLVVVAFNTLMSIAKPKDRAGSECVIDNTGKCHTFLMNLGAVNYPINFSYQLIETLTGQEDGAPMHIKANI